ncbi:hypothetical protein JCM16303_000106 [Sporobolomyces ruberrimus]
MDKEGTSSLIGVGIAVLANCLISAGLNVERLAHIKRAHPRNRSGEKKHRKRSDSNLRNPLGRPQQPTEHSPLIIVAPTTSSNKVPPPNYSRSLSDPLTSANPPLLLSIPAPPRRTPSHLSTRSTRSTSSHSHSRPRTDKGFLRSPLWIGGFFLINLGEVGNFLAYGFAPTSLVAPLGMTALVANVFLAPAIVGEPFRRKDLVGIAISILGGATVVYASRSNDKKITPHHLVQSLKQPLFLAYSLTSLVLMSLLTYLSQTRLGDKYVLIDLGLCALAGAFTVLSTKALSSFLNLMFLDTFREWITYPLLLVLLSTAFIQVNFINKSLQRFESRVVIPTQYMTFALSSIVGSAILYRDFEGVTGEKMLNFGFGCVVSAGGVYLLTRDGNSSSSSSSSNDSTSKNSSSSTTEPSHPDSTSSDPTSSSSIRVQPVSLSSTSTNEGTTTTNQSKSKQQQHLSLSLSPTTRILLPPPSTSSSHSSTLPIISTLPIRPVNLKGRNRKLSIGRFATGGYLLVGSPSGRELGEDRDRGSEEEEGDGVGSEDGEDEEEDGTFPRRREGDDQV